MSSDLADTVLATFIIFCRVGACLMLVPGFSSVNISPNVRLFTALVTTFALTPLLLSTLQPLVAGASQYAVASLIFSELMVGFVIGFSARIFFLALQTGVTAMAGTIGMTVPGIQVDEAEAGPVLVPLITAAVTTLFFITDQHWEVLRGLINSYNVWRPQDGLSGEAALTQLSGRLSDSFILMLRISSPFIIYGIVVNLAIGLANKLTPTIPIYFIAMPFTLLGGLLLLYLTSHEMLLQFMYAFSAWLTE